MAIFRRVRFQEIPTDVVRVMLQDHLGDALVACNGGRLVGGLVAVVEQVWVGAPEQQHPGTRLLVVERAHVQRGVAGVVAHVHLSAVEKQVFQMLHSAIFARLEVRVHGVVRS